MAFLDTVQAYFAALRDKDKDAWLSTFSPDLRHEDPVGTVARTSLAELSHFWDVLFNMLETAELSADEIYPAGNEVAVRFTGRGRSKAGAEHEFTGIAVFVAEGDKIASLKAYWDAAGTLAQLA